MNVPIVYQIKTKLSISLLVTFLVATTFLMLPSFRASAADNDFSNGITVDSTGDSSDANLGNGVCDDGAGNCTLRAAIEEANDTPGIQTIGFNISGSADFTNNSQDGYTISIGSSLPDITQPAIIDGFTQFGATPNSTVSPAPMDATLLIQIDGNSLPLDNTLFTPCLQVSNSGASGTEIRGLVINNCGDHGISVQQADDVVIAGNYIGTDPTGLLDEGNGRDFTSVSIGMGVFGQATENMRIGGSDAADRNIIAGNQAGDIFFADETDLEISQNNIVQGNYVGVGADGVTPLPSGYDYGLGNAILLGHSFNDLIGGAGLGEGNVIGSSLEFGVSFRDGCEGQVVQGNYIGTDYTGNNELAFSFTNTQGTFEGSGHISGGVHAAIVSNGGFLRSPKDILIGGTVSGSGNVISGNAYDDVGIAAPPGILLHDGLENIRVQGNYVGVGADGVTPVPNEGDGISIFEENSADPVQEILIGGDTGSAANIIAHNLARGITLTENDVQKVAIIGNSIYDNGELGIDLGANGVSANDPGDNDSGHNQFLNFPEYASINEAGGDTTVEVRADLPAGDYRIEFFSNTAADASGNGEGEEYLGFGTVTSNGTGRQNYTIVLSGVTGVTNLALTATELDPSTPSGFGATSEFGAELTLVNDLSISKSLVNPEDVMVGASLQYQITVTNEGLDDMDISGLDNSNPGVNGLFIDVLPAELSYDAVASGDISCLSFGEGSASLFGPILASHSDHELISCGYTGVDGTLGVGESVAVIISVTVDEESDLIFENIVIQSPNSQDPDVPAFAAAASSGNDLIDELGDSVNNVAYARYPIPEEITDNPASTNSRSSSLTETGGLIIVGIMVGGALIFAGLRVGKRV